MGNLRAATTIAKVIIVRLKDATVLARFGLVSWIRGPREATSLSRKRTRVRISSCPPCQGQGQEERTRETRNLSVVAGSATRTVEGKNTRSGKSDSILNSSRS